MAAPPQYSRGRRLIGIEEAPSTPHACLCILCALRENLCASSRELPPQPRPFAAGIQAAARKVPLSREGRWDWLAQTLEVFATKCAGNNHDRAGQGARILAREMGDQWARRTLGRRA